MSRVKRGCSKIRVDLGVGTALPLSENSRDLCERIEEESRNIFFDFGDFKHPWSVYSVNISEISGHLDISIGVPWMEST